MAPRKVRWVVGIAAALALAVVGAFLVVSRGAPLRRALDAFAGREPDFSDIFAAAAKSSASGQGMVGRRMVGRKVIISAGKFEVTQFLQVLQDVSGVPVIADPSVDLWPAIEVLSEIRDADGPTILAILRQNGLRFSQEDLPDGTVLIKVHGGTWPRR